MGKLIDTLLGAGWKAYAGGVLMIIGAIGLGADYVSELIGMDIYPDRSTKWPEVTGLFGMGLAALGIRSKQDRTERVVTEGQEDIIEDMENLPQKKGTK